MSQPARRPHTAKSPRTIRSPFTLANLWTTAGFVALHFAAQPPGWALAVALPSLVFGHIRERFGSVVPAITLHALYNAGFAVVALWVHP